MCFLTNTALELAAHDPEAARGHVKATETAAWPSGLPDRAHVLTRSRPEATLLASVVHEAMRRLD